MNAGQVYDKERIYEKIWGYDAEGDSAVVAEHIRRIRAKLAKYGEEKTYRLMKRELDLGRGHKSSAGKED